MTHHSASYSLTIRAVIPHEPGQFARVAAAIGDADAVLGAIDLVRVEDQTVVRDISVLCADEAHGERVVDAIRAIDGIRVASVSDRTFLLHKGGKIEMAPKVPIRTRDDLSMAYTPGVARVSRAIAEEPEDVWNLTSKGNAIAVVTDGTAVLGLGDIGPRAALPVMEGKAMLFKEFAGVDAWPICLDTRDPDEIVRAVELLAPGFGGINLEDISAPRCFAIERRLQEALDIPVFHDDQHGTAITVLAALRNALRVVGKEIDAIGVAVVGTGAAGTAVTEMLQLGGVRPAGKGFYYPPTVLTGVSPQSEMRRAEIFGPVAPVYRFDTEDQAVAMANDTEHGLAAYVYTRDLKRGLAVSGRIEAGMVGLNRGLVSDPAAPFGGVKQSGLGREGGMHGILEYLEAKYIATSF